jgi:hypothetical protein
LTHHIRTHLQALDRLEQHGYRFPNRRVRCSDRRARTAGAAHCRLDRRVPVSMEAAGKQYYDGLRFMISANSVTATTSR